MATLYNQADSNIRKTWLLMFVFFVLVIFIGWLFSYYFDSPGILYFAVLFSFLMSFGSYWYSDKIVFAATHAKPIEKKDNPEIYKLVENLCIASGLPLPKIYILPESQPNAFATGRNEKHSAIALTDGLIRKLEKSEIEGVIAHELSHIKNKDTLIQTIAVVLVGVVVIMSDLFLRITFWGGGGRSRAKGSVGLILMIGVLLAAILAPIAASLMKLSIARKREFLADASGALMTRYPEGLANALSKISNDSSTMKSANNAVAHLFIVSPLRGEKSKKWTSKLFLTHPPVEERVNALLGMKIER